MKTVKHTLVHIDLNAPDGPALSTRAASLMRALQVDWDAMAEYFVPIGYEDETGFHYGAPQIQEPEPEHAAA